MPLLSVALWKHFVYIFFGGFEKRVAAGVEVRKLTPAKHRPPAELQSSFWMRWLPLNRCLPHTASEAPWCDAAAFSHQPHWCIDDANDRTTLYTLFKYQMMKERLHLGRDLFIFFILLKNIFINVTHTDPWISRLTMGTGMLVFVTLFFLTSPEKCILEHLRFYRPLRWHFQWTLESFLAEKP